MGLASVYAYKSLACVPLANLYVPRGPLIASHTMMHIHVLFPQWDFLITREQSAIGP